MDLLCFCSVLCLLCLCARLFICALWSPAGKGLTSWLSFVVSSVNLSLSHWYPGSGVVLDCIDSWSLHHYLFWLDNVKNLRQYILRYTAGNILTSLIKSYFLWWRAALRGLQRSNLKRNCRSALECDKHIFKIFIWGGVSSDIRSEIVFYGSARASP